MRNSTVSLNLMLGGLSLKSGDKFMYIIHYQSAVRSAHNLVPLHGLLFVCLFVFLSVLTAA